MMTLLDIVKKFGGIKDKTFKKSDKLDGASISYMAGFNKAKAQWRSLLESIEVDEEQVSQIIFNYELDTEFHSRTKNVVHLARLLAQSTEIYKRKES